MDLPVEAHACFPQVQAGETGTSASLHISSLRPCRGDLLFYAVEFMFDALDIIQLAQVK
jgi:hypothetical protein